MSHDAPVPSQSLRLLLVEDQPDDAALLVRHLKKGGYDLAHHRVDTEDGLRHALRDDTWDLVLSDFNLPGFDGIKALNILRESGKDLPFIIVSGSIGEDAAVEAMKAGANDYIMKDNLRRLLPAVQRELREASSRDSRRSMEKSLRMIHRLTATVTGEDFLNTLVEQLAQTLGASAAYVAEASRPPDAEARLITTRQGLQPPPAPWALSGRTGRQLQNGETVHLPTGAAAALDGFRHLGATPPEAFLAVPFVDEQGYVFGYLGLELSGGGAALPMDLPTLQVLAARAGAELKRKRAEENLKKSEERYALAVMAANDGLWDWDLTAEKVYYSKRWKELLGQGTRQLTDSINEWIGRVHPEDRDALREELQAHLDGTTPHFEMEHRMVHRDGTYRWILSRGMAMRDDSGKAYRMAGSATDITARKRAERQLLHDAFHDGLTTLPNRALFLDRLSHAMQLALQNRRKIAVMVMDLDRFKLVNDSMGHLEGDQLLIGVTRRLEECLGPTDTLARLAGDEFAILMENIKSVRDATKLSAKIAKALETPFTLSGREVSLTASVGIVLGGDREQSARDLLRNADIAMHQAKTEGKARHQVFQPAMHQTAVEQLQLDADLRSALKKKEFTVHYQPIVHLHTGKVMGMEALARWHHPHQGAMVPGQFIPMAEETGLILPIGTMVLREACTALKSWLSPERPELVMSVNLSVRQFAEPNLVEKIRSILVETGLDPRRLRLEITESVLMENTLGAASMVEEFKRLGVQTSLDDFGTGFSSLGYLHQLPIDTLKIDRSFVEGLGRGRDKGEIVKTILQLGENLGMTVVAEGIETQEQLTALRDMGCQLGQGFLFCEPVDAEGMTAFLGEH